MSEYDRGTPKMKTPFPASAVKPANFPTPRRLRVLTGKEKSSLGREDRILSVV